MLKNHTHQQQHTETFLNATAHPFPKIYQTLHHIIPGQKYPPSPANSKQSHSLFHYARRLLSFLLSLEMDQFFTLIKLKKGKTLHAMYSKESLVILSNSINLHSAICKAQEYNIPLIQIFIQSQPGEAIVKERIILNFQIAHLINQNFVLYGDWQEQPELTECLGKAQKESEGACDGKQGLYFRRGEMVYGFIDLNILNSAEDLVLQQNLIKLRNNFYAIENQMPQEAKHELDADMNSQPSSNFEPDVSHFGAMAMQNNMQQPGMMEHPIFQDNFNDSDNEMEIEEMEGE